MTNPRFYVVPLILILVVGGCGRSTPNTESVRSALDSQLPTHLNINRIEFETVESGEGEISVKFQSTVTAKENLFLCETGSKALLGLQGEILDLTVEGKMSESLSTVASQAIMEAGADTVFLRSAAKAGEAVAIYGRIPGEYVENKVVLREPQFQEAEILKALPKGSFPGSAIVIGSPAEQQKQAEVREKIRQLTEADTKRAQEKAAALKQQEETLLGLFKPGRKLTGLARNGRFSDPIEMIIAENSDPVGKLLKIRMQNPANPEMYRDYTGTLDLAAVQTPDRPVAVLTGQPPVQDFRDPRNLYGPIRQIYGRAEGSTITVFFTGTGLRGECSGYRAPEILLEAGQ